MPRINAPTSSFFVFDFLFLNASCVTQPNDRYPFYAAEVFTCEVKDIIDQFFVETKPETASLEVSPEKEPMTDTASTQAGHRARNTKSPLANTVRGYLNRNSNIAFLGGRVTRTAAARL